MHVCVEIAAEMPSGCTVIWEEEGGEATLYVLAEDFTTAQARRLEARLNGRSDE